MRLPAAPPDRLRLLDRVYQHAPQGRTNSCHLIPGWVPKSEKATQQRGQSHAYTRAERSCAAVASTLRSRLHCPGLAACSHSHMPKPLHNTDALLSLRTLLAPQSHAVLHCDCIWRSYHSCSPCGSVLRLRQACCRSTCSSVPHLA